MEEFLTPVPEEFQNILKEQEEHGFPLSVDFFQGAELPEITEGALVLFGVNESRGNRKNPGCEEGPNRIRQAFYTLHSGPWSVGIIDLGNIRAGADVSDTYLAISKCTEAIVKAGGIAICIGGSQDLTYGQYLGYQNLEQAVNLAAIDRKFDLGRLEEKPDASSFLSHVILKQPNYLFNYSHLAYQSYYTNPEVLHLFNKMNFDAIRLGHLRSQMELAEPVLRDSDMLSIDVSCLQASDFRATAEKSPNGLRSDEICAISRYAGISDKISSFGLFEYNPEEDRDGLGAELMAQVLWYFVSGVNERKKDYPFSTKKDYQLYHVISDNQELSFYKSPKSGRWWIQVPYPQSLNSKYERHALIPCSYEDYEEALEGEIPNCWWRAFYKLQ